MTMLIAGASYVNIFYLLRTKDKYATNRELCINTCAMWNTFGILLGSLFELALFKTIFSDKWSPQLIEYRHHCFSTLYLSQNGLIVYSSLNIQ